MRTVLTENRGGGFCGGNGSHGNRLPNGEREDLLHNPLGSTHGLKENAGVRGGIYILNAPLLLSCWGREKMVGSCGHPNSPSVARQGSVTTDESKSLLGSGTPGLEISGSGERI